MHSNVTLRRPFENECFNFNFCLLLISLLDSHLQLSIFTLCSWHYFY